MRIKQSFGLPAHAVRSGVITLPYDYSQQTRLAPRITSTPVLVEHSRDRDRGSLKITSENAHPVEGRKWKPTEVAFFTENRGPAQQPCGSFQSPQAGFWLVLRAGGVPAPSSESSPARSQTSLRIAFYSIPAWPA